jgi:hypothetical protein
MPSPLPQCPRCHAPVAEDLLNRPEPAPCPVCAAELQVEIFPALFRSSAPGREGEVLLMEGESSCFYHPEKKAVRPCDACGRFVCALCDCDLRGAHYCPACVEAGATRGRIKNLETRRVQYDSVALGVAIIPIITVYFTIFTAPVALFIAIRYWNKPRSLVRRTRLTGVAAIILALAQMGVWTVVIYVWVSQ